MSRLQGKQEELGGLLFGASAANAAGNVLRIRSVETYCSTGLHQIIGLRKNRAAAPSAPSTQPVSARPLGSEKDQPVGYYWIASEWHSEISKRDSTLMSERFHDAKDICIAIRFREEGRVAATFFFWQDERLESVEADFPALLMSPIPKAPVSRAPIARHLATRASRSLAGYGKAAVGCVAIATLAVAVWVVSQNRDFGGGAVTPPMRVALGLTASQLEGGVLLTWNAQSAEIVNAVEGVLSVTDGQVQTNTRLKAAQLADGRYWYLPLSQNVQFNLDILRADGRRTRDSAIVILPNSQVAQARPEGNIAAPPSPATQLPVRARLQQKEPALARGPNLPVAVAPEVPSPAKLEHMASPLPEERATAEAVPTPEPAPMNGAAPAIREAPAVMQSAVPTRDTVSNTVSTGAPGTAPAIAATPITPPIPVEQPKPIVPANLERMLTRPTVIRVTLRIDETGRVVDAHAASGAGPVATSLANVAVATTRLWKFRPAREGNRPVPTVLEVQFKFGVAK